MPELPEAEQGRRTAEENLKGHLIKDVYAPPDDIVFDGVTSDSFAASLRGRTVTGTGRRGKHIWLQLDQPPWPVFHFGMDGNFFTYEDESDRPRFLKCELIIDTGLRFGFTNARRLGRIRLQRNPLAEPPISELGFDPLNDLPDLKSFTALLVARKAPIKAVLLDQSFAAGIGNWLADEILYQSRIAPQVPANALVPEQVAMIYENMKYIVSTAVELNADSSTFPKEWLFHVRWSKGARTAPKTLDGKKIRFDTVGGRTSAWVPAIQKGFSGSKPTSSKKKRTPNDEGAGEASGADEGSTTATTVRGTNQGAKSTGKRVKAGTRGTVGTQAKGRAKKDEVEHAEPTASGTSVGGGGNVGVTPIGKAVRAKPKGRGKEAEVVELPKGGQVGSVVSGEPSAEPSGADEVVRRTGKGRAAGRGLSGGAVRTKRKGRGKVVEYAEGSEDVLDVPSEATRKRARKDDAVSVTTTRGDAKKEEEAAVSELEPVEANRGDDGFAPKKSPGQGRSQSRSRGQGRGQSAKAGVVVKPLWVESVDEGEVEDSLAEVSVEPSAGEPATAQNGTARGAGGTEAGTTINGDGDRSLEASVALAASSAGSVRMAADSSGGDGVGRRKQAWRGPGANRDKGKGPGSQSGKGKGLAGPALASNGGSVGRGRDRDVRGVDAGEGSGEGGVLGERSGEAEGGSTGDGGETGGDGDGGQVDLHMNVQVKLQMSRGGARGRKKSTGLEEKRTSEVLPAVEAEWVSKFEFRRSSRSNEITEIRPSTLKAAFNMHRNLR